MESDRHNKITAFLKGERRDELGPDLDPWPMRKFHFSLNGTDGPIGEKYAADSGEHQKESEGGVGKCESERPSIDKVLLIVSTMNGRSLVPA
jgi:hypothetical protein